MYKHDKHGSFLGHDIFLYDVSFHSGFGSQYVIRYITSYVLTKHNIQTHDEYELSHIRSARPRGCVLLKLRN